MWITYSFGFTLDFSLSPLSLYLSLSYVFHRSKESEKKFRSGSKIRKYYFLHHPRPPFSRSLFLFLSLSVSQSRLLTHSLAPVDMSLTVNKQCVCVYFFLSIFACWACVCTWIYVCVCVPNEINILHTHFGQKFVETFKAFDTGKMSKCNGIYVFINIINKNLNQSRRKRDRETQTKAKNILCYFFPTDLRQTTFQVYGFISCHYAFEITLKLRLIENR